MRIAYVCGDPGIPVLGDKGAAVHVRELIRGFATLGHRVALFAARTGQGHRDDLVAEVYRVGLDERGVPGRPQDVVREREWSCVMQHDAWMASLAAEHARSPFDLVYERYSLWTRAGAAFARRHRLPYVVEVNSPLRDEQQRYRSLAWTLRAERVERLVYAAATAVVAVSEGVARHVRAHTNTPDRVHVVENGVDLALYAAAPACERRRPFTVGFLGSLKPWHGVDVLIAAAARVREHVPALGVRIVGDGPERASLERMAHEFGIGDVVEFTGSVPKREVPAQLASMDVATAPYPRLDGFYFSPLKVYDYLASGRPIVASRVGHLPHLLRHGETALLVAPGDVDDLARALVRLWRSPSFAGSLGRAARADAVALHGWDARARRILGLATEPLVGVTAQTIRKDVLSWHVE